MQRLPTLQNLPLSHPLPRAVMTCCPGNQVVFNPCHSQVQIIQHLWQSCHRVISLDSSEITSSSDCHSPIFHKLWQNLNVWPKCSNALNLWISASNKNPWYIHTFATTWPLTFDVFKNARFFGLENSWTSSFGSRACRRAERILQTRRSKTRGPYTSVMRIYAVAYVWYVQDIQ